MRKIPSKLSTMTGNIASGSSLQSSLPGNVVYDEILLHTNLPASAFQNIKVMNGSDDFFKASGHQIVNVFEKHRGREPGNYIPIRFADCDANTIDGQDATALVTYREESWLLKVEFGTIPAPEKDAQDNDIPWFVLPYAVTSPFVVAHDKGNGETVMAPRMRQFERRYNHQATPAVIGENTFDKLIRGADINIRTIYLKPPGNGAISHVKFEGRRNGSTVHMWEASADLNAYIQTTNGQKTGIKPVDGWYIVDPIATGFALADMESTLFDEIKMTITSTAAGMIDVITDYVKRTV